MLRVTIVNFVPGFGAWLPTLISSGFRPPLTRASASVRGVRRLPVNDFYLGVKRSALEPDELIAAIWVTPPTGAEQFSKIGTRNAMVISVAAFGLALHADRRAVGTGIGSAAPTPRRAPEAEQFAAASLDWDGRRPLDDAMAREFGELVRSAASPIDDVRGTAAYRLHALSVMARRTLAWAWHDYQRAA